MNSTVPDKHEKKDLNKKYWWSSALQLSQDVMEIQNFESLKMLNAEFQTQSDTGRQLLHQVILWLLIYVS